MWFFFALLSAVFAAATSILAKVGMNGVNSNYQQKKLALFNPVGPCHRSLLALLFPGAANGRGL